MKIQSQELKVLAEKKYHCAFCKGKNWYQRNVNEGIVPELFLGNPESCKILIIGSNPALRKTRKKAPINSFDNYWNSCINWWNIREKEGRSIPKDRYFGRLFSIVSAVPSIKWNQNVVHCDIVSCPTRSKRDVGNNRDFRSIAQQCSKDIKKFIELLQPKIILTNDVTAAEILIGVLGLDSSRKTILPVNDNCRLVPAGVTHSGRMDRFSFQRLKNDFKKAYES
jgi:hypothetical protein